MFWNRFSFRPLLSRNHRLSFNPMLTKCGKPFVSGFASIFSVLMCSRLIIWSWTVFHNIILYVNVFGSTTWPIVVSILYHCVFITIQPQWFIYIINHFQSEYEFLQPIHLPRCLIACYKLSIHCQGCSYGLFGAFPRYSPSERTLFGFGNWVTT